VALIFASEGVAHVELADLKIFSGNANRPLAQRIADGEVPSFLSDKRVLALDQFAINNRTQLCHPLCAERRHSSLGNESEGSWKFDDVERVGIHAIDTPERPKSR